MARNEEKHAGRLNRLWLQRLDEENAEKNPSRPGLGSLQTAEQVKKWMPSIKKDLDFYLKQSQVGCYPERKIAEFSEKIESLTKEYKAYIRKYRSLGGDRDSTPWSDQPYSRKHKTTQDSSLDDDADPPKKSVRIAKSCEKPEQKTFVPISLPIMDNDDSNNDVYTYSIINLPEPVETNIVIEENNKPLEFNWNKCKALEYQSVCGVDKVSTEVQNDTPECLPVTDGSSGCSKCSCKRSEKCNDRCSDSCKCSNRCSDCSSILMNNTIESLTGSPCKSLNREDHRKFVKNDTLDNMPRCKPDSLLHETNSVSNTVGDNSSNQAKVCDFENTSEEKPVSKESVNVLNLPYSDSSGEEDS